MSRESEYKGGQPGTGPAPEAEDYRHQTYYEILGVEPTATAEEIHDAYRKLAAKEHPDRGGDPEKSKYIGGAWMTLKDAELRAKYDRRFAANGPQKSVSAETAAPATKTKQNIKAVVYHWEEMKPEPSQPGRRVDEQTAGVQSEAEQERVKKREERLAQNREELERMKAELEQRRRRKPDDWRSPEGAAVADESEEPETREPRSEKGDIRIEKAGKYYHLVDEAGQERSSDYDMIEERDGFMIGISKTSPPIERLLNGITRRTSRGYNKVDARDGLPIGQDSTREYLLDPETCEETSIRGFDLGTIKRQGRKIVGKVFGREEEIKIHEKDSETHRYSAVG